MWIQFERMFHVLAPFFDVEFRLRLRVTYPPYCIRSNRFANNGTDTARNKFGLVITALAVLYTMKRYWNKNIDLKTTFFQCFPKTHSQIHTNRLILFVFQCMCNMLKWSFLLENKTRNKITDTAFGEKFRARLLVESEMLCHSRDCIPAVSTDFMASIRQRFIASNTYRRVEEVEERRSKTIC